MARTITAFAFGLFCAGLVVALVATFVFHDVDQNQPRSEAFWGLCFETVLFVFVVAGLTLLLTFIGEHLLRLRGSPPRAKLGFWLGVAVSTVQYPCDLAGRWLAPKLSDTFLLVYLLAAALFSPIVLLWDSRKRSWIGSQTQVYTGRGENEGLR